MPDYAPPLDRLLTLGEPAFGDDWRDYHELGFGPEHIPELIRMATDRELSVADGESQEVWAPVHAWRALGQLRAEAAVAPLLDLLQWADDNEDDWANEDLPAVLWRIGRPAIPAVEQFLADGTRSDYARIAAARVLEEIPKHDPEARDACVALLTRALERAEQNDPTLNGFLISYLLDLDAAESAPVIERAFAADLVDETIAGDWEQVRYDLGLGPMPERTARRIADPYYGGGPFGLGPPDEGERKKVDAERKAKRKQAKKSRKQNRKRR
jgi:HEAT repeat protein